MPIANISLTLSAFKCNDFVRLLINLTPSWLPDRHKQNIVFMLKIMYDYSRVCNIIFTIIPTLWNIVVRVAWSIAHLYLSSHLIYRHSPARIRYIDRELYRFLLCVAKPWSPISNMHVPYQRCLIKLLPSAHRRFLHYFCVSVLLFNTVLTFSERLDYSNTLYTELYGSSASYKR